MSTIFPTSVPTKRLQSSITASASSFQLSDILGWSGSALTAADFGTIAYVVFRNANNTQIEIMEIDPSTIVSTSITITKRGLNYTGDLTTESSTRKYSWTKGAFVELGTHVPQLFQRFIADVGDETIAGIKTFTSSPIVPEPTTATQVASKNYVDTTAVSGAPVMGLTVKGIAEEATQAEIDAGTQAGSTGAELAVNPKYLKDSIYYTQLPSSDQKAALAGSSGTPSATNKYLTSSELTGAITMYAGATAPTNWLLCDGASYLQATYPALFAIISTTYGSADGTHFNVPDMRGRIPAGVGTGTGGGATGTGLPTGGAALTALARAQWKGEETHTLIEAELAAHTHTIPFQSGTGGAPSIIQGGVPGGTTGNGTSGSTGSGTAHNIIQPVMGLNFIIKT